MKLPTILLFVEAVFVESASMKMPEKKRLITNPRTTLFEAPTIDSPNDEGVFAPLSCMSKTALVPTALLFGLEQGAGLVEHGRWL